MADVTGTPGNDVLFFMGALGQYTATITNPYSGQTLSVDDEKNINSSSYEGLSGFDTLIMSNVGDVIFADSSVNPNSTDTVATQMLSNVERILAGEGGDVIVTASTNFVLGNVIIEGAGEGDIIWSNAGDDTLNGRSGDDIMDGGPGDDRVNGNEDNDDLRGGADADYLDGGAGDDTLHFEQDTLYNGLWAYNAGSPGITGTGEMPSANGTNGSFDTFVGGDGYDTIEMTGGDDTLFLYEPNHAMHSDNTDAIRVVGVEEINAGDGDDIIDFTSQTETYGDIIMNGGAGNDYLWSSIGNDTLNGGSGDDNLWGGIGNDVLYGGAGADILVGGPNASSGALEITTFSHEFGSDVIFPDLVERVDIYDLAPPRDDALGIASGDLSVPYETTATFTFQFTGAGYDNALGFYNIAADGTIQGVDLAFTNVKDFSPGDSATVDLPGEPDTDFGFFIIANGAKKNQDFDNYDLENGEFKFVYDYGKGGERLANISDAENDVKMVYYGPNGEEKIVVGSNNHIYHTTERGGATNLNSDNDTHVVSGLIDENDTSTLRIGFEDLPNLGDADYNDVIFDLTIESQTETTLLYDDQDVLYGGAGDDYIDGGVGDDVLIGGEGADTLIGGHGNDTFVFDVLDGMTDTIDNFELGADNLNITDVLDGFDPLADAIADFVQLTQTSGGTELGINADGDAGGAYETVAVISGGLEDATLTDLINNGGLTADQSFMA